MVFRGKPSKACERCRARRLRVSPNSSDYPFSEALRSDSGRSVTFRVALVDNVSEQQWLARDTGIRSNFEFKMKANLLFGEL
jgi:hypothetical protein